MKQFIFSVLLTLTICVQASAQLSRKLEGFRELEVTDKIRVRLIPADTNEMVITGTLAAQMELTQNGNVLRLKMTDGYILQGDKVSVDLYLKQISKIVARKGAQVSSGQKELSADSLYLSANEGAKIDLRIHATAVTSFITTGGNITLKGETTDQMVNGLFGGQYAAKELLSDNANVRVTAGGKCQVTAVKSVDVQTRAGGVIEVYGDPDRRTQGTFAGGKITFVE